MKNETKVFVTADADFCLLLRGEEKKLMSFEEVEEKLNPYALDSPRTYGLCLYDKNTCITDCLLIGEYKACNNLAEVCEKFIHLLWPENVSA